MNGNNDSEIMKIVKIIIPPLIPAVVTGLTLLVLWNQVELSKRQFNILNQGYLDVEPHMDFARDDIQAPIQLGPDTIFKPEAEFQALNFYVVLRNVGNLPVKYKVMTYAIFINGQRYNEDFTDKDNVIGLIYPKQQATFQMKAVYFNKLQHKPIRFKDIKRLNINNALRIQYNSSNDSGNMKEINRTFNWNIFGNRTVLSWDKLDDIY